MASRDNAAIRRMGGFLGLPILSMLVPMFILPILTRLTGAEGWGSIGAAQQIGLLSAVVMTFGWGIYGPPAVAQHTGTVERQILYRDSLVARLAVSVVVIPVMCLLTARLSNPEFLVDSLVMAVASSLTGLSPSWYCIGVADPGSLARYDVVPRLVATAIAIPAPLLYGHVWVYGLLLGLASIGTIVAFTRKTLAGFNDPRDGKPRLRDLLRPTFPAATIDAVGNAYGSTPQPIALASLPYAESSSFTSADKLYRIGLAVVVMALGNAFQGWTLDPAADNLRRRHLIAITTHVGAGAVGAVFLATLGPWVTDVLLPGDVAATYPLCFWYGVAFFFISSSTPLIRNLLIPHGRSRFVFVATVISSVVGLTTMTVAAVSANGSLIACGLAVSEIVIVSILLGPALRLLPPAPRD